jgi:two-component system, LytTR family, response regulator AlgR
METGIKMRILVVDDELPTREYLRRLLADTDGEHVLAGEAADAREAIACCRAQPIDVVLLDSQMPGMSGVEAVQQLATLERPPTIVFLTAEQGAPQPLTERQVAGCLLKPIRRDRLHEVLRAARRVATVNGGGTGSGSAPTLERRTKISARYRGRIRTVAVPDIIYLQADQKYVNVRHLAGELLVDDSLRTFELEFPDLFIRIHRNALVTRSRLVGLLKLPDGTVLTELRDCDTRLAVSRRHLTEVRRWLQWRDTPRQVL